MDFSEKEVENLLLFIERRRYYGFLQSERDKDGLSDLEMVEFGIYCVDYFVETKDWRFVNLALRILDSKAILAEKSTLERKISLCFKEL